MPPHSSTTTKETNILFYLYNPQISITALTVHNFSSVIFSQEELELLNRGLSFVPTPTLSSQQLHLHIFQAFDAFAKSLRQKYYNNINYPLHRQQFNVKQSTFKDA